jgi:2-oxo-4-hydroxy-4-carboxy-5-ureidoimidazoline decarboxylase
VRRWWLGAAAYYPVVPPNGDPGLDAFNALSQDDAETALRACCASRAWVTAVSAGRPYDDKDALLSRADAALAGLAWSDITEALDAHPRIGERAKGPGREAAWSRREQSGMDNADTDTREALVAANREYEARFGHIFLIFASGRTDREMLAAARERLANDDETERAVVRQELGRIVRLRLERLIEA